MTTEDIVDGCDSGEDVMDDSSEDNRFYDSIVKNKRVWYSG